MKLFYANCGHIPTENIYIVAKDYKDAEEKLLLHNPYEKINEIRLISDNIII